VTLKIDERMHPPQVVVAIPSFNEENRIGDVVRRCLEFVKDVWVIDDGSTDHTSECVTRLGARVVSHSINQGKGMAIRTALTEFINSEADYLLFMDADGQHDPSFIPDFIQKAAERNADVILGNRMLNASQMPIVRRFTNRFMSWVISSKARREIPDSQCGFRMLSRHFVEQFRPTTFRFDLESEMDLVEEYARLVGYDHIPETLPEFKNPPLPHDKNFLLNLKTSKILFKEFYHQAFNYAFVSEKQERGFLGAFEKLQSAGLRVTEEPIRLLNPLNEDLNVMRSTLSFGLSKNLLTNVHYGNKSGRLFEIGACFSKDNGQVTEQNRLGLVAWGQAENLWAKGTPAPLVFELKAAVESLLKQLRITAYTWATPQDKGLVPEFLHMGQFAHLVVEGKKVGFLGSFHPVWLEENKVRMAGAVAELDLEILYKGQPRSFRFQSISKYPAVERDFAFVMLRSLKVDEVLRAAKKLGGNLLSHGEVFDVYEGEKMEPGKKSVAIRLVFQDNNATLQEAQILEVQNKILEGLKLQFDVSLR